MSNQNEKPVSLRIKPDLKDKIIDSLNRHDLKNRTRTKTSTYIIDLIQKGLESKKPIKNE